MQPYLAVGHPVALVAVALMTAVPAADSKAITGHQAGNQLRQSTRVYTCLIGNRRNRGRRGRRNFPTTVPGNTIFNTYAINWNDRVRYAQSWNFSIQQEATQRLLLQVAYLGTKNTRLDTLGLPKHAATWSINSRSPAAGW